MDDWTKWDLQKWNERLLAYFFLSDDERSSPIVVLLITSEELVRATGNADASADEVRDAFVEAVRLGIRRPKSLLEHATNYLGWPGPPAWESCPRFVAHLLFTCIAASESSDDLSDEGSFVSRLRDLTHDQLPDHSLQMLPRLWEHLSSWLSANADRYRRLLLPNPGNFTRIGYTVKLSFPDRRDQRQLSELLDRSGLAGFEPPIGRVLSLVASERGRYRSSFLLAFDEFRRLFEASAGHPAPRLRDHRFWAAVREASLRGRGRADFSDFSVRLSLLGEEEGDRLILFGAADQSVGVGEVGFAELPIAYGSWRFALVPKGVGTIDADLLERTVDGILDGSIRLPGLSNHVDQGLLPFAAGTHGLLELAGPEQLAEISVVLVREAMIHDLLRLFSHGATITRPSSYHGWVQVHDLPLWTLPSADIDGTALSRTWILHQSFGPTSLRLVGGVRADDGWLGIHEVLPRVVAPGASSVVLHGPSGAESLTNLGDSKWGLPNRDLAGDFTMVALIDESEERRVVRFHTTPASEAFKPPTDADAWIVEGIGGTGTLSTSPPIAIDVGSEDCALLGEQVAYLGSDVGAFVTTPDAAAWRITYFGGRYIGMRGAVRGDAATPTN